MSIPTKRVLNPGTDDIMTVWWSAVEPSAVYITRGRNIDERPPFHTTPFARPLTPGEIAMIEPVRGDTIDSYSKRLTFAKAVIASRVADAAVEAARMALAPTKRYRIQGNVTVGLMVLATTYADLPAPPNEVTMREALLASITDGDIREAAADGDYDIDFSIVDEPEFDEVL
jgi:hypothetical protein